MQAVELQVIKQPLSTLVIIMTEDEIGCDP